MTTVHHEQADNLVSEDQDYSLYQEKIIDDNPIAGLELYRGPIHSSQQGHQQQPGLLSPLDQSNYAPDNSTSEVSAPHPPLSHQPRGPKFWLIASLCLFAIMASVAVIVLGILLAKNRGAHNQRYPHSQYPIKIKFSLTWLS